MSKEDVLNNSVQYIKSVGPKRAEAFNKIGIRTIRDLLFYFPSRHIDRTNILTATKAYGHVLNGYDGELTVIGKVVDKEKRGFRQREIFKVQLRDQSGFFECVWFQGVKFFLNVFNEGDVFAISGKPMVSKYGNLQFAHPDFDRLSEDESFLDSLSLNTGKIIPIYKIPKELRTTNIGDLSIRRIIHNAVEVYSKHLEESLHEKIISKHNLIDIKEAVINYHYPSSKEKLTEAKRRFKFEELFFLEILVALRKKNYQTKFSGNILSIKTNLIQDFLKTLPFELTKAQLKVLSEIKNDMMSAIPMNRLLQGDVGSGKTIVALIAMLIAIDNGYQAALMAPTEILADQHAKNISEYMRRLKQISSREIKMSLLIGGQKKSLREKNLSQIELNESNIIIGTHALLEEKVKFNKLGLIVIDEQHRFGVAQRGRLHEKSFSPDVIVMSATPIPRTLTMTVYGDLELSIIDEMPLNRKPVKTILRSEEKLPDIFKFIKDKIKDGYQSFIIYPLVEESEKLELKAAVTFYDHLKNTFLKELKVGLVHGRMSWQEKEEAMLLFRKKEFDVLVATTVIEVGIDIPNANIILINDAHRFGLSQLHQLRGRVGRGNNQAYCILVTNENIVKISDKANKELDFMSSSEIEKHKAAIRLQSMVKYNDGFKIAEIDLKLRGPGDIFGLKQSGFPEFKHADIITDSKLILEAKEEAFKIINEDPDLKLPSHQTIKKILTTQYSDNLKYSDIA
ncbi:MAG TPA: ATP-dependent DNA helicase RecG [Ignavibacteriaceae bacterium]|nr:ATP-dependent DNA helicase RecG [Ignavibacteriaceae bacterium]